MLIDSPPSPSGSRPRATAHGRRRRLALLGAIALIGASTALAVAHGRRGDDGRGERLALAKTYMSTWARRDYAAMYRQLTPGTRQRLPSGRFIAWHRRPAAIATATGGPRVLRAGVDGTSVRLAVAVPTAAFGTVRATLLLPVVLRAGHRGIAWEKALAFPGLRRGEDLRARTALAPRATLLAADGGVLAAGPRRAPAPDLADVARETVGLLGAAPSSARAALLVRRGVPAGATVGVSGLERALDDRLIGTPGGTLWAGDRVLARTTPRPAAPVRTTIEPSIVRSAARVLAGRLGGAVALDPRSGALLGFAGVPFSGLRPPGSTFKIITLVAALERGVATPRSRYAVATAADFDGALIRNHDDAPCGGSLVASFADSCNSVFATLGVRVGAERLQATARRLGFDAPAEIPGAATSTVPGPSQGADPLTVGSTAIGQGKVVANALQMTSVAATIARGGTHVPLTVDARVALRPPRRTRVIAAAVARTVQTAMRAVVTEGTGTAAAIDGVAVAGKTGTAEIGVSCTPERSAQKLCDLDDTTDTDAWFVGYATRRGCPSRAAVGVVLMGGGAGGDTAAPAARDLLRAAIGRHDGLDPQGGSARRRATDGCAAPWAPDPSP